MIPRAVFRAVDFWTHTDPYGGNRNVVRHIRLEEVEHNPESA